MTVELWVYRTGTATIMHILSKRVQVLDMEYQLGWDNQQGVNFASGPPGAVVTARSLMPLPINTWWHVAATSDGSLLKLYINGQLVATTAGTLGPKNNAPLRLGAIESAQPYTFEGLLDEVSIYNRALSADEILAIYMAGSAGKCTTPTPPVILTQPQAQTVDAGSSASFSVNATGSQTLHYQWQLGGLNLANATNSVLNLTNVQAGDSGAYRVVVVNDYGYIISADAALKVNTYPPTIPTQPLSQTISVGMSCILSISGNGSPQLMYQWYFNDAPLVGETNTVFKLDSAQLANAGIYYATVSNLYGGTTSSLAAVTVRAEPPLIITQPQGTSVLTGVDVGMNVIATGSFPLVYQWRFEGTNILGASKSSFSLGNVQPANTGNYDVVITNAFGSVTSLVATLTVHQPPLIVVPPISCKAREGTNVSFAVTALGDEPLNYRWSCNGTALSGQTNAILTLTNITKAQAGDYTVTITNPYGTATSNSGVLDVIGDCFAIPTGLVGWWSAENSAHDLLSESVGELKNGAAFAPGKVGQAFSLTNGAYVEIPDSTNVSFSGTQSMTVELWVYRTGSAPLMHILSKRVGAWDMQYQLGWDMQSGINFAAGAAGAVVAANSGIPLPVNTWWHLAATADGSSLKLYINGKLAASAAGTLGPPNSAPIRLGIIDFYEPLPFVGLIDEVSLYNRALTAEEIDSIYEAGGAGKCASISPSITAQPVSQSVDVGSNATFSVSAIGSDPLRYQWQFNGADILQATNAMLSLTNIQAANAGAYSVIIANDFGYVTSSNASLKVIPSPAWLQIANASAEAGHVVVPISLVAMGTENAIGFSINFDPGLLSYTGIVSSADATSSSMIANTNLLASGKLGLAFTQPVDTCFPAGTQQLAGLGFKVITQTNSAITTLSFGDQPTLREVASPNVELLIANYVSGVVLIPFAGYEGDVAPLAANGDNVVTILDWVETGRLVAGLDVATNDTIFQRADCAPRATLGDGSLTVADWVQAGRYAAGLDPVAIAGGPIRPLSAKNPTALKPSALTAQAETLRALSLAGASTQAGQAYEVSVQLVSQANENGLEFSLQFDPTILSYVKSTPGAGAGNASLNVNTKQVTNGLLGFVLVLPTASTFAVGNQTAVKLSFNVAASAIGHSQVAFTNSPLPQQLVDVNASELEASYVPLTFTITPINGNPTLKVASDAGGISFVWPSWAGGYVLDVSTNLNFNNWTIVTGNAVTNGELLQLTLPISATETQKFYRLRFP